MKNLYRILGMLLLLPLFSGCNDSDDVTAIFTGKTWKLNFIAIDGDHTMYDFWDKNAEAQAKSIEQLTKTADTYTLVFEGLADGDNIQGNVNGKTITSNVQGTWNANGKSNNFRTTVKGSNDNDILAKNFLEGLNNAVKYEGDSKNLYILYKNQSTARTFRMFFTVKN